MKKILLASAIALFGLANAQENSIKVNPFALLGGSDLVSYERAIGEKSSVGINAGIGGFKLGGLKYTQGGGGAFYRYYFGDQVLKGWYGHGGVSYSGGKVKNEVAADFFMDEEVDNSEIKFGSFGVQAKAGYQWVWNSGFTLDLNAGLAYSSFNYKGDDTEGLKGSGFLPAFGVALGYSF